MFEKLLSLLLHAKGGAVATVFVLGTTGALVTATVENGMTTVTITQTTDGSATTPTGSNTTTTTTTVDQAILALFTRTSHEDDPTSTATAEGCSDEAHERNEQMWRVNDHFKTVHEDVRDLGTDAVRTSDAKELGKDADTDVKDIRTAAVKAIHATFDCEKDDEAEDVDEEDVDEEDVDEEDVDEDETSTTTELDLDFSGLDAEEIADLAIELMDGVLEDLEADLEGVEEDSTTTNASPDKKSDNAKNDNKGKGKGRGSDRN